MSEWIEYKGTIEQIEEMRNAEKITQRRLMERLNYDQETGIFTWRTKEGVGSRVVIGSTAGTIKTDRCGIKYLRIYIDNKRYYAHRLAWLYIFGEHAPEGMEIDHIDGNGLNNSIANLRCVDKVNNQRNRRMNPRNTSGKTGVFFCNTANKWAVQIGLNNHRKFLGHFDSLEEAIQARSNAEVKYNFHPGHGKRVSS